MVPKRTWHKILVSLLPHWLLSIAVMAEGFPRPSDTHPIGVCFLGAGRLGQCAAVILLMASQAANHFWEMTVDLGCQQRFPDAYDCTPLAGRASPW
ncbi:MAG: hypothetical protein ACK2U1_24770 [Anaerolineales bacterium]